MDGSQAAWYRQRGEAVCRPRSWKAPANRYGGPEDHGVVLRLVSARPWRRKRA
jgi:hypothetical protein